MFVLLDKFVQVPRGSDATLNCSSITKTRLPPGWEWNGDRGSNIKTLVVNSTAYLLVENFQQSNEGKYDCVKKKEKRSGVTLQMQNGKFNM